MSDFDNTTDDNDGYRHELTEQDRARVVKGIYSTIVSVRDQHGNDHVMMEAVMYFSDGKSIEMWVPVPLLGGLITACAKTIEQMFPPGVSTHADVSDDMLRQMSEAFAEEFRDAEDDPNPDRKHDDQD